MRIALFDYKSRPDNATGLCHLRILQALCHEHNFTLFAVEFENPCPQRIRWVRIPAPKRPLALLFVAFHFLAPLYYWAYRLRNRMRFDLVQMVESNLMFGDISYSHFCHQAHLQNRWRESGNRGLRGFCRWLDHWLHALIEPWIYRRVVKVVVPSRGLARELAAEYPSTRDKIVVLSNPVEIERMRAPAEFDREGFRQRLGANPEDLLVAFIALGLFEHKGLPQLLGALQQLPDAPLRLVVVGGERDLVQEYQVRINAMGLGHRALLTGKQKDVRPYLWAADVLALPSCAETFPLAVLEAAAAGLPLLVTRLNGVEEFLRDGENGILLERTPEGVAQGIRKLLRMPPKARRAMGERARQDVQRYSAQNFAEAWKAFYERLAVA